PTVDVVRIVAEMGAGIDVVVASGDDVTVAGDSGCAGRCRGHSGDRLRDGGTAVDAQGAALTEVVLHVHDDQGTASHSGTSSYWVGTAASPRDIFVASGGRAA